jgi:hypothetical protein
MVGKVWCHEGGVSVSGVRVVDDNRLLFITYSLVINYR